MGEGLGDEGIEESGGDNEGAVGGEDGEDLGIWGFGCRDCEGAGGGGQGRVRSQNTLLLYNFVVDVYLFDRGYRALTNTFQDHIPKIKGKMDSGCTFNSGALPEKVSLVADRM